jgi:hypothetical protein
MKVFFGKRGDHMGEGEYLKEQARELLSTSEGIRVREQGSSATHFHSAFLLRLTGS